jgi:Flp pilus assembly protein TadG
MGGLEEVVARRVFTQRRRGQEGASAVEFALVTGVTRRRREERGASAVEFALVMPILLLLVFGIITYGMVFAQSLSLSNSARQAARSAVVEGTTCGQVTTLATDSADTLGMDGADATAVVYRGANEGAATASGGICGAGASSTQPCKTQAVGTNVYVTLSYDVDPIVPFIPVPSTLTGRGVYRCEFS